MSTLMLLAAVALNPAKETVATHANLSVYPIYDVNRGASSDDYISLDEGLKAKTVIVTETGGSGTPLIRNRTQRGSSTFTPQRQQQAGQAGTVNTLWLTNKSGKKLLLLSGEIVSGGKQDRIVQQDTLIRPSKEPVNLSVFCVEHGRWVEKSTNFSPAAGGVGGLADPSVRGRAQHEKSQEAVWSQVDSSLGKLKTDNATKTYQANLSNAGVQKSVDAYVKGIQSKLPLDKVVGVAVAVNGKMVWMDCFSSNEMFRTYWPKMIKSYALEAMQAMERMPTPKPPTYDEAMRYADARDGKKTYEAEDGVWKLTKIEAKSHVIYELEDLTMKTNLVLHASKMAK
jgi:hypothetical protein